MWYVYILECENDFLYTGVTQDIYKRFQEHFVGAGAYFTGYRNPKRIAYFEPLETEVLAKQRESQIKSWSRSKKQALIQGDLQRLQQLSVSRD